MSMQQVEPLQIKPEIVFIFELLKDIRGGKIRIPRFQRPYVWRRDQMIDLLDSIRRHYPIGSLLIWDTESKYASTSQIGPVEVPPPPAGNASYVLDGHQRLSTLAGAFLHDGRKEVEGDDDPGRWTIWYNLKEEYFEHLRPADKHPWYFPLRKLLDTFEFLDECERLKQEGGPEAQMYVERIKQLLEGFQSYKMPVVRILSTDIGQAVEIFARLNSKGQRISTDQIVSALAYEEGTDTTDFNLATEIDRILDELREFGFGGLQREFILRTVLAILGEDIYQKDWTRIFTGKTRAGTDRSELKSRLPDSIGPTKKALGQSIEFLRGQGIDTDKLLPYSMQIVLLAVFFHHCPEPAEAQRDLLQRWFWVSSFTGWFGSANPSRVSWLIDELREAARNPDIIELKQIDLKAPALPFPSNFDWRSSRVRCTVLAMLERKPCDTTGKIMPEAWKLIVEDKITAVSRILTYPAPETEPEKTLRSSPANRIVNVARERGQAKKWLFDLDPAILEAVLESHGIPLEAFAALRQGNYREFLEKRLEHLEAIERDFMLKRGVTPPTDSQLEPPAIDTGDD